MEHLVAKKSMAKYDPYEPAIARTMVFQVQCRMCSFEPEDVLHPPRTCPKCHSQAWERFARPGSILQNADRYDG
jgi:predicted Zn-ribbon and HTH transcriptional regulator